MYNIFVLIFTSANYLLFCCSEILKSSQIFSFSLKSCKFKI